MLCDLQQTFEVTAAPTEEPLSLAEAKSYARIETAGDDDVVRRLIAAARRLVERETELALLTQTHALYLDRFPDWELAVRRGPIQSISSIAYLDTTGQSQTLSSSLYRADLKSLPPRLTPAYNQVWPQTYLVINAVTITFVAGYTSAALVPEPAREAVAMLVSDWYWKREAYGMVGEKRRAAFDDCLNHLRWGL